MKTSKKVMLQFSLNKKINLTFLNSLQFNEEGARFDLEDFQPDMLPAHVLLTMSTLATDE